MIIVTGTVKCQTWRLGCRNGPGEVHEPICLSNPLTKWPAKTRGEKNRTRINTDWTDLHGSDREIKQESIYFFFSF
jgi:hypothetical protein